MRIPLLLLLLAPLLPADTILRSAPIPNRLLRQGDALVLDTDNGARLLRIDLHTRHLARVEAKIVEAESLHWPESPHSAAFRAALRAATVEALRDAEGPVAFRIDWSPDSVLISHGDRSIPVPGLSPDYIRENRILIAMDRFDIDRPTAEHLLTP